MLQLIPTASDVLLIASPNNQFSSISHLPYITVNEESLSVDKNHSQLSTSKASQRLLDGKPLNRRNPCGKPGKTLTLVGTLEQRRKSLLLALS